MKDSTKGARGAGLVKNLFLLFLCITYHKTGGYNMARAEGTTLFQKRVLHFYFFLLADSYFGPERIGLFFCFFVFSLSFFSPLFFPT